MNRDGSRVGDGNLCYRGVPSIELFVISMSLILDVGIKPMFDECSISAMLKRTVSLQVGMAFVRPCDLGNFPPQFYLAPHHDSKPS